VAEFQPHEDVECISEWESLEAMEPELAGTIFHCAVQVSCKSRFQAGCEKTFASLRQDILRVARDADKEGLSPLTLTAEGEVVLREKAAPTMKIADIPGKVAVWDFLVLLAYRRQVYVSRVAEVVSKLEASSAWRDALAQHTDLLKLKQDMFGRTAHEKWVGVRKGSAAFAC